MGIASSSCICSSASKSIDNEKMELIKSIYSIIDLRISIINVEIEIENDNLQRNKAELETLYYYDRFGYKKNYEFSKRIIDEYNGTKNKSKIVDKYERKYFTSLDIINKYNTNKNLLNDFIVNMYNHKNYLDKDKCKLLLEYTENLKREKNDITLDNEDIKQIFEIININNESFKNSFLKPNVIIDNNKMKEKCLLISRDVYNKYSIIEREEQIKKAYFDFDIKPVISTNSNSSNLIID